MKGPKLVSAIKKGDRQALAKSITLAESDSTLASELLRRLNPPRKVFVIGVTGPPGTGKSTLVDRLIVAYRKKGMRVAVIAVDPTSPITGGALLGDRIRMAGHGTDKGVYIRSMASRGWSGGLSKAASQAIQLVDAAGFDMVFIETVGIGQSDIDVVRIAHAALVVLMPGLGDDVQASKAGLMEVGDIYVVNKSDLEGSDAMVVNLLGMARSAKGRSPVVLKVSARSGEGLETLVSAIDAIRLRVDSGDLGPQLKSLTGMIIETAKGNVMEKFLGDSQTLAETLAKKVLKGKMTIDEAAAKLTE